MSNIIKIPIYKDQKQTLVDYFDDKKDETLHKFYFDILVNMTKNAKDSILTRLVSVNLLEKGKLTPTDFPLKDLDLDQFELVSDPNWLPKEFDPEFKDYYEFSCGDKFHNNLLLYCKLYNLRINKYNESIPTIPKTDEKTGAITQIKDPQFRELQAGTCLEDVIHKATIQPMALITDKAIQEIFDKENEIIVKTSSA